MKKTIWVKAKPGLRIPRPESSYRYVEGDDPVEVDVSTFEKLAFWTRRIEHGECDKVDAPATTQEQPSMAAAAPSAPAPASSWAPPVTVSEEK